MPFDIDALKAKHGPTLVQYTIGELELVAKPPRGEVVRRFRAQLLDEARRPVATENLVRACIVYPDKAALDAIFEEAPLLVEAIGEELVKLAGAKATIEKKVL